MDFAMLGTYRKATDLLLGIGGCHHGDGGGFTLDVTGIPSWRKSGNPKVVGGVRLKIRKSGLEGIANNPGGYEVVEFWISGGLYAKLKLTGEIRVTLPIGRLEPIQGNGILGNFHHFHLRLRQNLPS